MEDKIAAQLGIRLMDLTSLSDDDTDEKIVALAKRAKTDAGSVAALCVYPRFVPIAKKALRENDCQDVRVATVCVFPHGRADIELAVAETKACVAYGADEVDTVLPYNSLKAGDIQVCRDQLQAVRNACGELALKVILETGQLVEEGLIRQASDLAIEAGADFIKTSTGKVSVNATPAGAKTMLAALADSKSSCGLKIAGGVRTVEDAKVYLQLAEQQFGAEFLKPNRFRFGASGLLDALLATLEGSAPSSLEQPGY